MANRIKSVSTFDGTNWSEPIPLGADDANIDITTKASTSSDTSKEFTADAVTISDADTLHTALGKFNTFKQRIKNALIKTSSSAWNYVANATDNELYTAANLNQYFSNIIGFTAKISNQTLKQIIDNKLNLTGGTLTGRLNLSDSEIHVDYKNAQTTNAGATPYLVFETNMTKGTTPTAAVPNGGLKWQGTTSAYTARIVGTYSTAKAASLVFEVNDWHTSDATGQNKLTLSVNGSGAPTVTVSAPEAWRAALFSSTVEDPIALTSGQNLNNITTPGYYYASTAAIASSLANRPSDLDARFGMLVVTTGGSVVQLIFESGVMYQRLSGSTWGQWYKYSGTQVSTTSD